MIIDLIFAADIIVVFCTPYHDENFKIIDDRWVISTNYLKGMFIIDVVAVFPFD